MSTITERLQARGWAFDAQGTLQPPLGLKGVPLGREIDAIGDRYFLEGDLLEEDTCFDVEAWWRAKEARDAAHLRFLGL